MKRGTLLYDGGTFELEPEVVRALLERGVIVADDDRPGHYWLAPEHLIDEVEPAARVRSRLTGTIARQQGTDARTVTVTLHVPNGFGGRR
jgi:hypothetical protein